MGVKKRKNLLVKQFWRRHFEIFMPLITSVFLILVWFWDKKELAGGEAGIFFYTAKNNLEYLSYAWSDVIIGAHSSSGVAIQPLLKILVFLNEGLGIPHYLLQAFIFFLVLYSVQVSTGFITRKIHKQVSSIGIISAQLFSILNLAAIAFIWNRFQYPFIIFYALLPLSVAFLYFSLTKSKIYILVLNVILFIFAFSLTALPVLMLYWGFLFIFFTYLFFFESYDKNKVALVFAIHFLVWGLCNFWWLHQFYISVSASSFVTGVAYTQSGNLGTFDSISGRLGDLSYLIRAMHKDFYKEVGSLWGWYNTPIFIFISFIPVFFIFGTLFIQKKSRGIIFFLVLSLLILYSMKGSSGPFGYIFKFLFSQIRFLEPFRNPTEKFALLLPLVYAPLFGIGLSRFSNYMHKKFNKSYMYYFPFFVLILTTGMLTFPMWTGRVFMSKSSPQDDPKIGYKIEIPEEYKQVNEVMEKTGANRILVLPLGPEGATYTWKYGYSGVELSSNLFTTPVISFQNGSEYLTEMIQNIQYTSFANPKQLDTLLQLIGVDGVLVRTDIDWKARSLRNPHWYMDELELNKDFKKIFENTYFSFFIKNTKSQQLFTSSEAYILNDNSHFADIVNFLESQERLPAIINVKNNDLVKKIPTSSVIKSETPWSSTGAFPMLSSEEAKRILPNSRYLPGNTMFKILRVKETLSEPHNYKQVFYKLNILNKRLSDMVRLLALNDIYNSEIALSMYLKELSNFQDFTQGGGNIYDEWSYSYIRHILSAHKRLMHDLLLDATDEKKQKIVYKFRDGFLEFLSKTYQIPRNEFLNTSELGSERTIFILQVKNPATYQLYIDRRGLNLYDPQISKITKIQLDEKIVGVEIEDAGSYYSLGEFYLEKGTHEIQIPKLEAKNMVGENNFSLSPRQSSNFMTIENIDDFADYVIDFKYQARDGKELVVELIGSDDKYMRDIYVIQKNVINFELEDGKKIKSITAPFTLSGAFKYYGLRFVAGKYGACDYNEPIKDFLCSKKIFPATTKNATVDIQNLTVKRLFSRPIVAMSEFALGQTYTSPQLEYSKIDPTRYVIRVVNAQAPYILSFMQKFHSGWQIRIVDTGEVIEESAHILVNSFANGWKIDKRGDYLLVLEFQPEKSLVHDRKTVNGVLLVIGLVIIAWLGWLGKRKILS